jgi:membrane protease subunit HflK
MLIVVLLWLVTGVYMVGPGEQSVVRRFGREVARTGPGLRYHWPRPIERVDAVNLAVVRRIEVGFRSEPRYRLIPRSPSCSQAMKTSSMRRPSCSIG